jgi:hypothetical protein
MRDNEHVRAKSSWLLRLYAWIICYRFRRYLYPLEIPDYMQTVLLDDVKAKARASLTTSGVFFAFSIAVLTGLIGGGEITNKVQSAMKGNFFLQLVVIVLSVILPYLVIWQERFISAASVDGKTKIEREKYRSHRYPWLIVWLCLSLIFFMLAPGVFPRLQEAFTNVFSLAGFVLIICSAFFLLFALEFYDTASGWRGSNLAKKMYFHFASLASHSTLIGVSLALVGVFQLLSLVNIWFGEGTTLVTLIMLVAMPEIERALGDAAHLEESDRQP